jgi:ring-1,2-phenylacetyl-CoA epoxidase subunit PaaB
MQLFKKFYYGDFGENKAGDDKPTATERIRSSHAQRDAGETGGDWPLWEVFIRSKQGLDHKHAGSLHAADAQMAIENARDVYCRRMEGISIWVVESKYIHASSPDEAESLYEPANDKIYRHPTFYTIPDEVKNM